MANQSDSFINLKFPIADSDLFLIVNDDPIAVFTLKSLIQKYCGYYNILQFDNTFLLYDFLSQKYNDHKKKTVFIFPHSFYSNDTFRFLDQLDCFENISSFQIIILSLSHNDNDCNSFIKHKQTNALFIMPFTFDKLKNLMNTIP